eukprot:scaffold3219_cov15-Tisochrysis_lutea.AAC.2
MQTMFPTLRSSDENYITHNNSLQACPSRLEAALSRTAAQAHTCALQPERGRTSMVIVGR